MQVAASAVNFPDVLIIQDKYQVKPPLPFSPGSEFAGVVKKAGSFVKGVKTGDRVVVMPGLSCGRCGTPICPRCLVYTPAGTRCPSCASIGRPKMYVLGPLDYAKAAVTAIVVGIAVGFVAALLISPIPRIGLFSLVFAVAGGYAVGTAIASGLVPSSLSLPPHGAMKFGPTAK